MDCAGDAAAAADDDGVHFAPALPPLDFCPGLVESGHFYGIIWCVAHDVGKTMADSGLRCGLKVWCGQKRGLSGGKHTLGFATLGTRVIGICTIGQDPTLLLRKG